MAFLLKNVYNLINKTGLKHTKNPNCTSDNHSSNIFPGENPGPPSIKHPVWNPAIYHLPSANTFSVMSNLSQPGYNKCSQINATKRIVHLNYCTLCGFLTTSLFPSSVTAYAVTCSCPIACGWSLNENDPPSPLVSVSRPLVGRDRSRTSRSSSTATLMVACKGGPRWPPRVHKVL